MSDITDGISSWLQVYPIVDAFPVGGKLVGGCLGKHITERLVAFWQPLIDQIFFIFRVSSRDPQPLLVFDGPV